VSTPVTPRAPLVLTRTVGDFRIHALDAGAQRLDGGAMFGVVPKPLWERRIPADDRNRIPLAMRCLLVETRDALVLIDNGAGNKENDRFIDIYGIDNASSDPARWPTRLEEAIAAAGFSADDVDVVIDTHLHFDHAGGNTRRDVDGRIVPAFARARYVIRRGEWDYAHTRNERIQASYLPDNFEPLLAAGLVDFATDDVEVVPGISLLRTPGHTPHHQSVLVRSGGEAACFLADVVPTSAHLPLPWIMGYDVEPLVTLETKRALLRRARDEQWLLVFEHDPAVPWGVLEAGGEKPVLRPAS
jgi:glyoxylase-like metal-dependent hydrolase (beta-lactamase superfamily II)